MDVLIAPRSRRSFAEACARAGLEPPSDDDPTAFGEVSLRLLIEGIDFGAVGCPVWWSSITMDAPQGNEPVYGTPLPARVEKTLMYTMKSKRGS